MNQQNADWRERMDEALAEPTEKAGNLRDEVARLRSSSVAINSSQARSALYNTSDASMWDRDRELSSRTNELDSVVYAPSKVQRLVRNRCTGDVDHAAYKKLESQRLAMGAGCDPSQLRAEQWQIESHKAIQKEIAEAESAAESAKEEVVKVKQEQSSLLSKMLIPVNSNLNGASVSLKNGCINEDGTKADDKLFEMQ